MEKAENIGHWILWVSAVCYGLHSVWRAKYDVDFPDFLVENSAFGQRDRADFEWETWLFNALLAAPFCLANFMVASFLPSWKLLQIWRVTCSCAFLLYVIGPVSLLVLAQTALFHALTVITSRRAFSWATCLLALIYLNSVTYEPMLDESNSYLMGLVQSWVLMRNMSYCLDVQEKRAKASLIQALAHALYLPLLFSGPVVMYDEYLQEENTPRPAGLTKMRLMPLLIGMCRYLFWGFVLHLWLHLIYSAALSQMVWHLQYLPIGTMYAIVYCLGQFFMLKYSVIYGLAGTLARAEGIPTKEPPKCIARIHLYSDMWRHFDPGLYTFLNRQLIHPFLIIGFLIKTFILKILIQARLSNIF
ncbi:Hypothetical predicted protein [Cloeon dipterum]|uniref:Uncharacterized protein n=1 Tax=Cloeon dipterum TaxID=197152 RepID=A0A8S1D0G8_9INSE|nr:Hypothetical predicted protein [Cloeon dipterum]